VAGLRLGESNQFAIARGTSLLNARMLGIHKEPRDRSEIRPTTSRGLAGEQASD